MARFYNTARPRYVDDFVFDPNIELAQQAIAAGDQRARKLGAELNLFGNLPLEFHDRADRQSALEIKREYEARVDEFMKEIGDDWLNTNRVNKGLAKIRRDIEEAYNFGEIKDLAEHKKRLDGFEEAMAKMNPGDRQRYKENIIDPYMERVQGRGIREGMIEDMEFFETKNYFQEFINDYLEKMKASSITKSTTTPGRYIVTTKNGTKEVTKERLLEAYKTHWNQDPDLRGRARIGERSFGETWFDPEGNLSFEEGSMLGTALDSGLEAMAWREKIDETSTADNTALMQVRIAQRRLQLEEEASARAEANARRFIGVDVDFSAAWEISDNVRKYEQETVDNLRTEYYKDVHNITGDLTAEQEADMMIYYENNPELSEGLSSIPNMRKYFGKNRYTTRDGGGNIIDSRIEGTGAGSDSPFADKYFAAANRVMRQTEEAMKASNASVATQLGMSREEYETYLSDLKEAYTARWEVIPFQIMDNVTYTTDSQGKRQFKKIDRNQRGTYTVGDLTPTTGGVGKRINLGKGRENVEIVQINRINDYPIVSPMNKNINDSDMVATYRFTYKTGETDENGILLTDENGNPLTATVDKDVLMNASAVGIHIPN